MVVGYESDNNKGIVQAALAEHSPPPTLGSIVIVAMSTLFSFDLLSWLVAPNTRCNIRDLTLYFNTLEGRNGWESFLKRVVDQGGFPTIRNLTIGVHNYLPLTFAYHDGPMRRMSLALRACPAVRVIVIDTFRVWNELPTIPHNLDFLQEIYLRTKLLDVNSMEKNLAVPLRSHSCLPALQKISLQYVHTVPASPSLDTFNELWKARGVSLQIQRLEYLDDHSKEF